MTSRPSGASGYRFNLALIRESRGVRGYEAEIAQTPKSFRSASNLGRLLLSARRGEEARARLRDAVEWHPDFGTGYLYRAKTLLDAGELEEAEEAGAV